LDDSKAKSEQLRGRKVEAKVKANGKMEKWKNKKKKKNRKMRK